MRDFEHIKWFPAKTKNLNLDWTCECDRRVYQRILILFMELDGIAIISVIFHVLTSNLQDHKGLKICAFHGRAVLLVILRDSFGTLTMQTIRRSDSASY